MMARSAVALDSSSLSGWLGAALTRHGVVWTWERLVIPVFEAICARQAATGAAIEVEHVFSDRVLAALLPLVKAPRAPVNDRPVLLACAEDEQHSLPIYALAAALATEHRIESRVLGARTPFSALAGATRRSPRRSCSSGPSRRRPVIPERSPGCRRRARRAASWRAARDGGPGCRRRSRTSPPSATPSPGSPRPWAEPRAGAPVLPSPEPLSSLHRGPRRLFAEALAASPPEPLLPFRRPFLRHPGTDLGRHLAIMADQPV
nr:hypothetical protein GCM10020093_096540 [Planobispora longispora]